MTKLPALLPIKERSQRVPNKNFRDFDGKPLFLHILNTMRSSESVSHIYINTDSPRVQDAVRSFPDVTVIERPKALRADDVPMTEIIRYDLENFVHEQYVLQTHATNPLLKGSTIDRAVELFARKTAIDSLVSVNRLQTRLYFSASEPINHNPRELRQTQDLPPVYEENSNLYIFDRALILDHGRRFSEQAEFFEMDPLEAIDIDNETDFLLAELLCRHTHKGSKL